MRNTVNEDQKRDNPPDESASTGARFAADDAAAAPAQSAPPEAPLSSGPPPGLGAPSTQAPAYGTPDTGYPQGPPATPAYPQAGAPDPVPTAYPAANAYPQPGAYPEQSAYPQPGAYPQQASTYPPVAGATYPPATPPVQAAAGTEHVGRGLVFALGAVVVGIVLAVVLWQNGFIASFTSLLLASGAVWLYQKGAGSPPRKGALPLLFLILIGSVLALAISMGYQVFQYVLDQGASSGEAAQFALAAMFNPVLWSSNAGSALMFIAFAALGSAGVLRALFRTKG